MTEQEITAASCIEVALETKMTDCMTRMYYWRYRVAISPEGKEERRSQMQYWQGRLKDYFLAAIVACDACVTVRTPEEMMRAAAFNFMWIQRIRTDA